MKKLTDEQIIKALEICSDELIISCPDDCPFYDECEKDLYVLKRQALDLINRKDVEIERLNKLVAEKQTIVGELSALITDTCEDCKVKLDADKAKSEAYNEFAERLHQNCKKYPYTLPSVLTNIEIAYKELTEGGNEPPKNDFKE